MTMRMFFRVDGFVKSPISVLRFRPPEFHVQLSTLHSSGFCAPPDLRWGLNVLLCHPKNRLFTRLSKLIFYAIVKFRKGAGYYDMGQKPHGYFKATGPVQLPAMQRTQLYGVCGPGL